MNLTIKTILILVLSGMPVWGSARTYMLQNSVTLTSPAMRLDQLFTNAPELKNYSIDIYKSKFFSNQEISSILEEKGVIDPVVGGSGIQVKLLSYDENLKTFSQRVNELHPDLEIPWDTVDLPFSAFSLEEMSIEVASNTMVIDAGVIAGGSNDTQWIRLIMPVKKKTPSSPAGDQIFLRDVQGNTAHLVYRKGGLMMQIKARILKDLGEGFYEVQNPLNGRKIKVRLFN